MATITLPHQASNTGQIALESALFCLECELIFAGEVSCPRCTSEAVWPLAEWVHPIRSGVVVSKRESDLENISQNDRACEPPHEPVAWVSANALKSL